MAKVLKVSEKFRGDVITLLQATRQYIATHPKRWTKNAFGRDASGKSCSAASPVAKEFCALGFAIDRAADLFGYEMIVAPKTENGYGAFIDTEDGGDNYLPGQKVYRLNKKASTIYKYAERALDRASVGDGVGDGIVTYNDHDAQSARDIVAVYDRALELLDA